MSVTPPPTIDTPPPSPIRGDRATFSNRVDAFVNWLILFVTQIAAVAANVYNNATSAWDAVTAAFNSAVASASSASEAAASAAAAALSTNVTKWAAGVTYLTADIGKVVWSPTDFQNYRLKIAGTSTVDPALEDGIGSPRMWRKINYELPMRIIAANATALPYDHIAANSTDGSFTITAPANPVAGETWFEVFDYAGTFAIKNVTVDFNGAKFEGIAGDTYVFDINNFSNVFRYVDTVKGWVAR
ncbi:hypothetical protein KDM87_06800 [Undibacterium sp. FT147W]|uniref:Uncharacterized protein n=1 Tax=Undibacterium rivi TaxID=2828729 RepID=A0ABS5H1N5_9BURK|nr:hypothetical protein [Undibacterium rivi]MBR7792304.1 hypothetical protein [Undibacterium rivi]